MRHRAAEGRRIPGRRSRGQALVEFALVAPLFFVLLLGIVEVGRYIFYYEMLNNATKEGARYAIVHGANSACPSGPPPPGGSNTCDLAGNNVKIAVRNAAIGLVGTVAVPNPIWTTKSSITTPNPGDPDTGTNARGDHVTVFVDYTYSPIIGQLFGGPGAGGIRILPSITISAESTLVVNN